MGGGVLGTHTSKTYRVRQCKDAHKQVKCVNKMGCIFLCACCNLKK